jgi:ATP-dependent exoDNAse (exonuclease V) beta subunit
VHALLEQIVWLKPGELPVFPHAEEGLQDLLRQMLVQPSLHRLFEKPAGWEVELLQEQPFEVVVEGKWISGQLDRLHLERDASGAVRAAHILDYKTDRAPDPERHRAQMMDYRLATARLFQLKPEQIRCTLLFVRAACAEEILPGRG